MALEIVYIGYREIKGTAEIRGESIYYYNLIDLRFNVDEHEIVAYTVASYFRGTYNSTVADINNPNCHINLKCLTFSLYFL